MNLCLSTNLAHFKSKSPKAPYKKSTRAQNTYKHIICNILSLLTL